jgi:hypothetical protein
MAYQMVINNSEKYFLTECEEWLLANAYLMMTNSSLVVKPKHTKFFNKYAITGGLVSVDDYEFVRCVLDKLRIKHRLPKGLVNSVEDLYCSAQQKERVLVRLYMASKLNEMNQVARMEFLSQKLLEARRLEPIKKKSGTIVKRPNDHSAVPGIFYDTGIVKLEAACEGDQKQASSADADNAEKIPSKQDDEIIIELNKRVDELKVQTTELFDIIVGLATQIESALISADAKTQNKLEPQVQNGKSQPLPDIKNYNEKLSQWPGQHFVWQQGVTMAPVKNKNMINVTFVVESNCATYTLTDVSEAISVVTAFNDDVNKKCNYKIYSRLKKGNRPPDQNLKIAASYAVMSQNITKNDPLYCSLHSTECALIFGQFQMKIHIAPVILSSK